VQLKIQCRSGDENITVSFLSAPSLNLTTTPSDHDVCFNNIAVEYYLNSTFIHLMRLCYWLDAAEYVKYHCLQQNAAVVERFVNSHNKA